MIKINAHYYNGQSSVQTPVTVCFYRSGDVLIKGESLSLNTTLDQLTIAPRLANTRRNIFFSDGAKLETEDNASVDSVCNYFDKNIIHVWIHKLEKNGVYALIALRNL